MKAIWVSTFIALLALAIACSPGADQSAQMKEAPVAQNQRPDNLPLIKGPLSSDGLQAILATADLGVGTNRFGVVLTSSEGLVTEPTIALSPFLVQRDGSTRDRKEITLAVFRPWPYGTRGLYTTNITFDKAGKWVANIEVQGADGSKRQAQLFFDVKESTYAPKVGSPAVKSISKTIKDVDNLAKLTTGSLRDPELYQMTIAEAVVSRLPTVLVIASPAFCTNAVCGPQVDVLQQLKDRYKGKANFIHVDFYDNPHEIQGDLSRARLSPVVIEWNLPSIEWTFVIDRSGIVAARFEGFATLEEVEQVLQQLL